MDRKGWIILILCSIGLMLTWQNGAKDAENQRKLEAEKAKTEKALEAVKLAEAGNESVRRRS